MNETIHIAITRRVRREHTADFEKALAQFAGCSLTQPGSRGVQLIYPGPGSDAPEYGILRSFASPEHRDAFYQSAPFKEWLSQIEPLIEAPPVYRELTGLEAWFREPHSAMPPRWKMALLSWLVVWPLGMVAGFLPTPLLPSFLPNILRSGVLTAANIALMTWVVMPQVVKLAHGWLQPSTPPATTR